MAVCNRCTKTYEDIYGGCIGNQGWGCAASVVRRKGEMRIAAGYGSDFDLCTIKVLEEAKAQVTVAMEICDTCITQLIEQGLAAHDHTVCEELIPT